MGRGIPSRPLVLVGTIFALTSLSALVGAGMGDPREGAPSYKQSEYGPQPLSPSVAHRVNARLGGATRCDPWVRDGYVSIQVNVDAGGCNILGDAANEPSIAVDPMNPRKVVIGWREFDTVQPSLRQPGWGYSHDAGHTWVFPGAIDPGVFGSDPVLGTDAEGRFYYLTVNHDETRFFRSSDGGLSWPFVSQVAPRLLDKPWFTIDRTGGVGHGNIYFGGGGGFARSTDGGLTFEQPSHKQPSGFVLFPTLSVAWDGTLFVGGASTTQGRSSNAKYPDQEVLFDPWRTVDLGGLLRAGGDPNPWGLMGQTWVATDHSDGPMRGNVYVLASVVNYSWRTMFVRSTDRGETWTAPIQVNDDPRESPAYHWFGMMSVSPNGRIDAAWNDTRNTGQPNLNELFYAYSTDGGDTWSKNIPVSPVFDSWVGYPAVSPKLGDYYHMVSDNLGVNVAYAATFNGEQDVYFLRIGPWDCNGNEIPDEEDIAAIRSRDHNGNDVPDECEYRGDFDGDGLTTLRDYSMFHYCMSLLPPPEGQPHDPEVASAPRGCRLLDMDHDGDTDLADFAFLQRSFSAP